MYGGAKGGDQEKYRFARSFRNECGKCERSAWQRAKPRCLTVFLGAWTFMLIAENTPAHVIRNSNAHFRRLVRYTGGAMAGYLIVGGLGLSLKISAIIVKTWWLGIIWIDVVAKL